MAKKDEMLLAVNNAIDELNELRKKKSIVEVTERMTSTSKGSEWSAWASNDDKYKALLLETKTLYEIFESVVASLAEIRKRPVDTNTSSPAAAGASPLVSVDEENAGVEDSEVTHTKLSDITEVTYNGTTYKKYSAKSYAGLSTEVQYHELWDTLLKEIEDLFPIAVMAIQQANQLHVDKSHNYDVPNKANFTRDAKFLNWSDQWNKGPAAVNIQMNALMRDVNVLFMSIAKSQRDIDAAKAHVVESDVAIAPQVAHTDAGQDDFEKNVLYVLQCDKESAVAKIRMLDSLQKCVLKELACEAGKEEDTVRQLN
jgi:hypothetical protein